MKLNIGKTLLLGLGFLGVSALWAIYSAFVPAFLDKKFHLSPLWLGFFLTLDNITALIVQPPVGVWSDKLRTPIGRRMPFILVGAPLGALAFALVPLAPALPLFVLCTGTVLLAMALWRTPVMALMADVTPPPLRSQASGIISFMGGVGGIIAYFGGAYLFKLNPAYPFWLGSIVVIVAALLLFVCVKEPPQYASESPQIDEAQPGFIASLGELFTDKNRAALCLLGALVCLMIGYTAVEGFFSLYALNHLGWDEAKSSTLLGLVSLVFVLCALPSGNLGTRFGRRRTIMLGLLLMAALIASIYFLPAQTLKKLLFTLPMLGAVSILGALLMGVGLAWALVIIHPLPMLSNMVDNSRVGTYTGLYYGFTSLAAIIGPILNGWVVEMSGKNYNTVMLAAPLAFLLAWGLMWGVQEREASGRVEKQPVNPKKVAAASGLGAVLVLATAVAPPHARADAPLMAVPIVPSPEAIAALDGSRLSRGELSPEAFAFKQEVYRLHVARGERSGRARIFDLPPAQLSLIPGTDIPMRRDAAIQLGRLLDAARVDLARDLALVPTNPAETLRQNRARRVEKLAVGNAYRSASRQFGIWDRNFAGYYTATRQKRAASPGGEHGAAAAELLREYVGIRVAAPGFSNHQGGIAVDLALHLLPESGQKEAPRLGASMAQNDPWRTSWFWNWLQTRAGEFGFVEYAPEAWHWEFKPEQAAKAR